MNTEPRIQDSREVGLGVKSYDNVIPRLRDRRSNPIPRRYVSGPTLVTPDPEALLETARTYATSPQEGARLYPWLKSRAALAADANMRQVRDEMYARIEENNARAIRELEPLEQDLEQAEQRVRQLQPDAIRDAAQLGIERAPSQRLLPFREHEPISLTELAGELGVPTPEPRPSWWDRTGYKLMCALGGGGLFGLSLGLLAGKIELVDFAAEWLVIALFVVFGIMLITVVGGVIWPMMKAIGGSLYRRQIKLPDYSHAVLWFKVIFTLGFVIAAIVIESKVEQLGLLKVVAENSSLHGMQISKSEMLWVSLMLIVPIVGFYIVSGLTEGERLANLVFLEAERAKRRRDLTSDQRFNEAARALEQLCSAIEHRNQIKARLNDIRSQLRFELTLREEQRLEDLQMDVIRYSQEAEDVMLAADTRDGSWLWSLQKRSLWRWLRRR